MKKKLWAIGGTLAVAALLISPVLAGATTFSTTSLGTAIDDVSGTSYDYFTVLIAKFWPYLLGVTILVGVIAFGRYIIHKMFGK